jgi:DNA-binding GntR family transcriptional regulator
MGVSLAPLRDALQELSNEGLVEQIPKRGIRITNINNRFIEESCEIRKYLELGACRDVILKKKDAELSGIRIEMERIILFSEEGITKELLQAAEKADGQFHVNLVKSTQNGLLINFHERVYDRIKIIKKNIRYSPREMVPLMRTHIEIITMIENHDLHPALDLLETHLNESMHNFLGEPIGKEI